MTDSEKITDVTVKNNNEKIVKDIAKKRKSRKDVYLQVDAGDNARYLQHSMEVSGLPIINSHNEHDVQQRITEYFNLCIKNDMKPSIAGLALAFHCHRNTLYEWANDRAPEMPHECRELYKQAYRLINAQMEDYMMDGKINPVAGIFLMKNNMGYKDEQEYLLTPNTVPEHSAEELIAEANQLPDFSNE